MRIEPPDLSTDGRRPKLSRSLASRALILPTILVSLLALSLPVACGGTGSEEPSGGGGPRDDEGPAPSPPEIAGTWLGYLEEGDTEPVRLMVSMEQVGGKLSGHVNWSFPDGGFHDFGPFQGEVRPAGEFDLSYGRDAIQGYDHIDLEGTVGETGNLSGIFEIEEDNDRFGEVPFELERLDATDPEELSLALVEALHAGNYRLLYDHASLSLRAAHGGDYGAFAESVASEVPGELAPSGTFEVEGTELAMEGLGREEYNVYGTNAEGDDRLFTVLTKPDAQGPHSFCEISAESGGEEYYVIEPNCG